MDFAILKMRASSSLNQLYCENGLECFITQTEMCTLLELICNLNFLATFILCNYIFYCKLKCSEF